MNLGELRQCAAAAGVLHVGTDHMPRKPAHLVPHFVKRFGVWYVWLRVKGTGQAVGPVFYFCGATEKQALKKMRQSLAEAIGHANRRALQP